MEQFSLEKYLENPNRKVVTRDGRSARIICTDRKGYNTKPIIALVTIPNGTEVLKSYWEDGVNTRGCEGNPDDLFFVPEKREGWTNVYEEGTNRYLDGCICSTEEEAKRIRGCGYITTIKIEWEE